MKSETSTDSMRYLSVLTVSSAPLTSSSSSSSALSSLKTILTRPRARVRLPPLLENSGRRVCCCTSLSLSALRGVRAVWPLSGVRGVSGAAAAGGGCGGSCGSSGSRVMRGGGKGISWRGGKPRTF